MSDLFREYTTGKIDVDAVEKILSEKFQYYLLLNREQKNLFLLRMDEYLQTKKFVAREGIQITDEIRCVVCACAVQLTLGLDEYQIDSYDYILIYPDIYVNPHTKNSHHGETNMAGFICFSWKSIVTGLKYPEDNFHVGLHEWSHALRFNHIKSDSTLCFFDLYFPKVMAAGAKEYQKIKSGKKSFMRTYAGSNVNEFFAVSIEYFFESPEKFRKELPFLFEQFCILLNQEPRKDKVYLNVRDSLLEFKPHFLHTQLLAKGTSNGGLYFVMPFFLTFLAVAFLNFSQPYGNFSVASIMLLIALALPLFVIPRMKSMFIFKEGILLSWLLKGIMRKDPLLISYDQMIQVEFFTQPGHSFSVYCENINLSYYNNKSIREVELECRLSEAEVESLTQYLRNKHVNVRRHKSKP
jgi:hypothetical protein